ncbi:hypothetical protein RQP46_011394 [Phenoliferia psychrophenolica]
MQLGEHHSRRHQNRSALSVVQAKAVSLLTPPPASLVLGVREESELKAIKFSLATRLRDVRLAATNAREDLAADSLSTLRATHHSLAEQSREVVLQTEDALVRANVDLVSAYAFELASTFSDSSSDPFTSDASSSTSSLAPSESTYLIAELPIPRLADLANIPAITLSTVLSHLCHLVRLLALYYQIDLPFAPNPNLFEPGRPGVVAAPGWSTGTSSNGFPCFLVPRGKKRSGGTAIVGGGGGNTEGTEQSGGRELEGSIRDEEEKAARLKAVVGGAVALAYDFAWIAWRRGWDDLGGNPEVLDDMGALVPKALGGWPKDRITPTTTPPKVPPRSAKFPLDFAVALRTFTAPSTPGVADSVPDDTAEDGWDLV